MAQAEVKQKKSKECTNAIGQIRSIARSEKATRAQLLIQEGSGFRTARSETRVNRNRQNGLHALHGPDRIEGATE